MDSLDSYIQPLFKDTLTNDYNKKANLFLFFGKYYDKKNKEEIALKYLNKSEELFLKLNNLEKLAEVHLEKFYLLKSREHLDTKKKSLKYLNKFYNYAKKKNDKIKLKEAYIAFAVQNFNPNDYKKSLDYYDKAIEVSIEIKDTFSIAKINSNKGAIISYIYQNQDSARFFFNKSFLLFKQLKKYDREFGTLLNIGTSYKNENNHKEALKSFFYADLIPITEHKNNSKRILYGLMADSYQNINDYKNAYTYLNKYIDYKDSVDIKTQNIAISDIQTKYETAQKEKDIIQLEAEKDKQKSYLIIAIFIFIATIIVGLLAYLNLKRKRDLAEKNKELEQQKVVSLLKDQELKTLDAILEGQEKERKRISEDLHDNLGSKLAILKLQFDGFIDEAEINKDEKLLSKFINTSELLEDTYQTVRSMSHVENSSKINKNLSHLVKTLASNINNTKQTNIEITDFGLENIANQKIEIIAFRIIQELVTNAIKYAKSNNVAIDITFFDNLLNIIVFDDGIGFDTSILKNKGIGLNSIQEKIINLQGTFSIDTGLGNGTTIIIELPVNQKNI